VQFAGDEIVPESFSAVAGVVRVPGGKGALSGSLPGGDDKKGVLS
jgi:hypothetical protein